MSQQNWARAKAIFAEAVELPADQRAAFLEDRCGGDAALRERVEGLLSAHEAAGEFMDGPTFHGPHGPDAATVQGPPGEKVGDRIGAYKLLAIIGEGGFGSVYAAEQEGPILRRVALKVIKLGMDTRQVIARFEAERQALAMMEHPNIARVLEAGATATGRPFFVMDLVKGDPIVEYCDKNNLSINDRLELFAQVCDAVQHAHTKGIIHRDIKPSNILVSTQDGRPNTKVIDFGIAKATNARLTEKTLFTEHRALIGTPEYMSPEQAEGSLDIDTRTDVYSLGVLLYELLTGTTPFSGSGLRSAAYAEILRIIREVEPPKPSTRISQNTDAIASIAAKRHVEPRKLGVIVRGELDWIVMRALEKDRRRRYETSNALAMDIRRYLAGEAVVAAPPSPIYRARKFARRNRTALATAAALALLLLAGAAVSTWQAVLAHKRLRQVEKGNEIITSIFTDLDIRQVKEGTEPLEAVLVERLLKAREQLEDIGDPLSVAGLQAGLGESLLNLDHPREAIPLLVKARKTFSAKLGADDPETLVSMSKLAKAYVAAGELELGLPLLDETLKLRKARLGPRDPSTLLSMNNLAAGYRAAGKPALALPLFEESLKLHKAVFGPEDHATIVCMNNLGLTYQENGNLNQALPLLQESLKLHKTKLGPDHADTLNCMNNLGGCYQAAGKLDLAMPLLEECLRLAKGKLGVRHNTTHVAMGALASAYCAAGKQQLAIPLFEELLKLRTAKLGADHPDTLHTMNNLALAYQDVNKADLALPLLEEALKLMKAKPGADHAGTLACMNNLAMAYQESDKLNLALPLFEETLKLTKSTQGADHPDTLKCVNNLAAAYQAAGKLDLALPLYEEIVKSMKAKLGADDAVTLTCIHNLATCYVAAEKPDLALPLAQEAAAGIERRNFQHEYADRIVGNLVVCHERLQQYDKAEPWRWKLLGVVKVQSGANSAPYTAELVGLGSNLLRQEKWTDAEPVLRECLSIREQTQPDDWKTFNIRSMLGGALLGQKNVADAEPLLLNGYRGMKDREAAIPPQGKVRIPEALERLVHLYEAKGNEPEAAAWRSKLEAAKAEQAKPGAAPTEAK